MQHSHKARLRGEPPGERRRPGLLEYSDVGRRYGMGALELLDRLERGAHWATAARELFDGGSYGNGAAMRVAPLGAYFADDPARAAEQAARSAEVTHAHPEGIADAVPAGWRAAHEPLPAWLG
ncbi:ADP-ribosylglycohydrolase family protein [Actinomadura rayongensis]|uniref:ADP-ribosylglycohydrolase family protein n=1 Tax=Actinomadura rayongensis TaxID=1429076 RepID=UPI001925CBF2